MEGTEKTDPAVARFDRREPMQARLWWFWLFVAVFWLARAAAGERAYYTTAIMLGISGWYLLFNGYVRVRDLGDRLEVCSGPISAFRTAIRYDAIRSVRLTRVRPGSWFAGKSVPEHVGRMPAVLLQLKPGRTVRGLRWIWIGSYDPGALIDFLRERTGRDG